MTETDAVEAPVTTVPAEMSISIAPIADLVRPVRLAVGGIASLGSFDIESIEELQLAVNELLVALIDQGDGSALDIVLRLESHGAFRMEASTRRRTDAPVADTDVFSDRILSVMADDHSIEIVGDLLSGWFVRHPDHWADSDVGDLAG